MVKVTGHHSPRQLLNVALCMAQKIMRIQRDKSIACYEIDDLAQHAQQIIMEVEEREIDPQREKVKRVKLDG